MTLIVTGNTGPTSGGTPVVFTSTGLDMSTCTEAFAAPLNGAVWASLDAGAGVSTVQVSQHGLLMDTSATPGSVAGARGVGTVGNIDMSARYAVATLSAASDAVRLYSSFGLYVSATTYLRLTIVQGLRTQNVVVQALRGGISTINFTVPIGVPVGHLDLRIQRTGQRIIAYLNQALIVDTSWESTAAKIEFRTLNDATLASQFAILLTNYVRYPLVMFGSVPMQNVTYQSGSRLDGTSPAATLPGAVNVSVQNCSGTTTVTNAFTYQDPILYKQLGSSGLVTIEALSDLIVRQPT